ncbi:MAG TPA: phosphate signaling complex protein PhoU [Candidatus Limnocylindria bacterium]|jgi:phosphate transport system protein|nr:phosphate signaling complex protein PhoU [Candidatus Limnocylindria bacterium]
MDEPTTGQALSADPRQSVRARFEEALESVKDDVLRLGGMVEHALERSGQALVERDIDLADRVRWDDGLVNELQRSINLEITALIATQGPMARDVRELLALYHAAAELERMGDYAVSIAKLAQQLAEEPEVPMLRQIPEMELLCREQLHAAMRALVDVSEEAARAVCQRDDELDHLYASVYNDSLAMMAVSPDRVRQATHMLFAAHHLERLGDRVTNIGEDVVYLATGNIEDLNP